MELICDGCNAHRCVYSNKIVGAKGVPEKSEVEDPQGWQERGGTCGSKVPGEKFYFKRKIICGDYIDSKYYNHLGGNKAKNIGKGGRLVTENICETCYSFKNVLSDYEIKRSLNIGENNPLLICRDQFNSDI